MLAGVFRCALLPQPPCSYRQHTHAGLQLPALRPALAQLPRLSCLLFCVTSWKLCVFGRRNACAITAGRCQNPTCSSVCLCRSNVSLVVLVVEGTRGIEFMFGIILSVVIANWVAHHIHHDGVYESELERIGNLYFLRDEAPHRCARGAGWCFHLCGVCAVCGLRGLEDMVEMCLLACSCWLLGGALRVPQALSSMWVQAHLLPPPLQAAHPDSRDDHGDWCGGLPHGRVCRKRPGSSPEQHAQRLPDRHH